VRIVTDSDTGGFPRRIGVENGIPSNLPQLSNRTRIMLRECAAICQHLRGRNDQNTSQGDESVRAAKVSIFAKRTPLSPSDLSVTDALKPPLFPLFRRCTRGNRIRADAPFSPPLGAKAASRLRPSKGVEEGEFGLFDGPRRTFSRGKANGKGQGGAVQESGTCLSLAAARPASRPWKRGSAAHYVSHPEMHELHTIV